MNSPYEFPPYSIFKPRDNKFEEVKAGPFNNDYIGGEKTYVYSLIIPAYNEEKRIGPFLDHLKENLSSEWEIIVVCDGNDRTADIARSYNDKFKVLESQHRLGKGGAILEGFKASKGDIVGYVDADGAISVSEVLKVFSHVSGDCDVAVGSRWLKNSKVIVRQPLLRIILGRLYHYMAFAILGLSTKDTQCGIKAFKANTLNKILPQVTLKNLSFDTAILYHCRKFGSKIAEIPIAWSDVEGSKVNPVKTALIMFASLIGLRLAHSNKHKIFANLLDSIRVFLEKA